jgi:hypothetical protein
MQKLKKRKKESGRAQVKRPLYSPTGAPRAQDHMTQITHRHQFGTQKRREARTVTCPSRQTDTARPHEAARSCHVLGDLAGAPLGI